MLPTVNRPGPFGGPGRDALTESWRRVAGSADALRRAGHVYVGFMPRSRSQKACRHRLTHDRQGLSVCRVPGVPREPDPDWIIRKRQAVGNRVREQRELADLTQEELEQRAGVKRLTIQRIESGATDARISWLLLIARALGIHVTELLE